MGRPVHHYYHVYADGDWKPAVDEHLTVMEEAGFQPDLMTVGIVGSHTNSLAARNAILERIDVDHFYYQDEGWEHMTLNVLYEDATVASPFYAVYGHTKGAGYPAEINDYWRKVMDKYTIGMWKSCHLALLNGYYAVGPFWNQYMIGQTPYFAGNFWWARSEAIAELGPVPDNSRYEAEVWIGRVHSEFEHPILCNHNSQLSVAEFKRSL